MPGIERDACGGRGGKARCGGAGRVALGAAMVLGLAGAAAAQENYWFFDVRYSNQEAGAITSPDEWAIIDLWAVFDPKYYAFDGAELNFVTADDPIDGGYWSDPKALLDGFGFLDGTVEGESVVGIITLQLQFPPNYYADKGNPIKVWTALWHAADTTPRSVPITTDTLQFYVYLDWMGNAADVMPDISEGFGSILVIPAPAAGVLMVAGWVAAGGRRRAQ